MTSNTNISQLHDVVKINTGWKYYNQIKKKAMEQEFSWAGLIISVSIAFFIVMITAYSLNLLYASYKKTELDQKINKQIYSLEVLSSQSSEFFIQLDKISPDKIKFDNYLSSILA